MAVVTRQSFVLADLVPEGMPVGTRVRLRTCQRHTHDDGSITAASYILTVEVGNPVPIASYLLTHAKDPTGAAPACRTLGYSCTEVHQARESEAQAALSVSVQALYDFLATLL